jgi:hypothetical protein
LQAPQHQQSQGIENTLKSQSLEQGMGAWPFGTRKFGYRRNRYHKRVTLLSPAAD